MALLEMLLAQDFVKFTLKSASPFSASDTQMYIRENISGTTVPAYICIDDATNGDEVIRVGGTDVSEGTGNHKFTSCTRAKSGSNVTHTAANVSNVSAAPTANRQNAIISNINSIATFIDDVGATPKGEMSFAMRGVY